MNPLEAVSEAFHQSLSSRTRGDGEVLTLPLALSHGNLVQIYAERLSEERWFLTDQGQAAAELAVGGVSLETHKTAGASWLHLVQSIPLEPPLLMDVGAYELAGIAATGTLGTAILALGEAVLRGEGLRALAPSFRARRFRDVIVQAAGRHELPVVLDAPMPTRHGGSRPVSVAIEGARRTYVQAVSARGSALDGFDKAQAVFSSANVPADQLVAVLAAQLRLETWQWETLVEHGTPVIEAELDRFLIGLRASKF